MEFKKKIRKILDGLEMHRFFYLYFCFGAVLTVVGAFFYLETLGNEMTMWVIGIGMGFILCGMIEILYRNPV